VSAVGFSVELILKPPDLSPLAKYDRGENCRRQSGADASDNCHVAEQS
jgi:hypothetical protein